MKLKEYRKRAGLTQAEVATRLGIPMKTYQNYEREVREPDSDILCRLADLYGATLDDLMGRHEYHLISFIDGEEFELDEGQMAELRLKEKERAKAELFMMIYLTLDEEKQNELLDFAKFLAEKEGEK